MPKLVGKTALVSGGNSGIGLAVAKRFAQEGARVFITGRRQAQLDEAVQMIGSNATGVRGDVTEAHDLDVLFSIIQDTVGSLDILVTSAGMSEPATIEAITEDHFDRTFDLNVKGMVFTVKKALPLMGAGSTIVLIGSIAGVIGTSAYGSYGASKAAVRAYARTWTAELAEREIRVNVLSPGPIDTPMFAEAGAEIRKFLIDKIPMGRMGTTDEVASAALFLASNESSFFAGAELVMDEGMIQI